MTAKSLDSSRTRLATTTVSCTTSRQEPTNRSMILTHPARGGTIINGINDNGQLVGFYTDANNNTIGMVAAATTPEPASLLFLATGLLGFGGICRRTTQQRNS